ncbi:BEN domain-containing protein 5 [Armadillidium vulgare]|nr:BEN domain-containing protein 5 [Armadillidium vulgare]
MVFSLNGLNWINTFIIHLDISKHLITIRLVYYTPQSQKMATGSHEQLTEKDYLLLLLGIYIKHKLSDAILRDMIAMINFISGSNILPETLFKLFAPLKTYDSFEMHFYCAKCRNTHTSEDNRDTKMVCCDTICTNYFITFDMKEKIEKFLTVNASNIKCTRSNDNIIRDIFDGEVYKELSKTGFDPEKDLTFNFSLDGAPLSKSSTLQAWPIFITINEIDLKFRFKNIFTAGFWISSSQMTNDLNIKNLLTVFVNRMKILQNTGSLLDKKLFEIKVPNYINRKPRSVSKWKFWKATEFGNFLYYYIFILENILPVEYYKHILHLRAGLMLLLKRAVAKDDVIKANEHFHNFVCYFEILFGVQYSTFNIHMLLHLSQSVKKCGPLWGFSAFPFENNLRIFRTLITGSKIPTKQVVKKSKPSSRNKNKGNEIIFGSISFPEKPFLTISRRPKHSLFVKDLVSLLWSDEDLSQRSLTGKKHYNSKEIKQPLTPEKRFAIEEAFKDRLKKQQYHDAMIALELKLVNRYIVEKINDVKKCKSRRNLNMTYDIQNKNIPREEEKDLSENEPISNDMIN